MPFDSDETYRRVVRYYIDKKKYSLEDANRIAQKVVADQKEHHEKQEKLHP